jgi:DNA-damage-inducible protein D
MTSIEEKLVVFKGKKIRRTFHQDEWWFSVVDIIEVLSDSDNPKQYIKRVRSRDHELSSKWGTLCTPLELTSKDGKKRKENCRERSEAT